MPWAAEDAAGAGEGSGRLGLFTSSCLRSGQLGIWESSTVRFRNITQSPDTVASLFGAQMELVDAPLKMLSAGLRDSRVILEHI